MNPPESPECGIYLGRSVIYFHDRRDAGRQLAQKLLPFAGRNDVVVLGLARGGLPVAYEVAAALRAPLDVFIIRKLGHPQQPELAMGAIASGGIRVLNREVLLRTDDADAVLAHVTEVERRELERRESEYRGQRKAPALAGKVAVVVDDGLATGASMRAAVQALRHAGIARVIVAVPVGSSSAIARLAGEADELVCLTVPTDFDAVGQVYRNFAQTTDAEVRELLEAQAGRTEV
ncbi:MAG TPA: phosphoribosyltransferase family protein [Chthoniobacter sp.]|jgi:putative phosphoribosyl transferase